MPTWNLKSVSMYYYEPAALSNPKACKCGRLHHTTTDYWVLAREGLAYFNCPCGSTLVSDIWGLFSSRRHAA
jgi:hypothetical protein